MARHCPKCNFFNPYSAQICGECGQTLIFPKTMEKPKKPDHLNLESLISWKYFGIEKESDIRDSLPKPFHIK